MITVDENGVKASSLEENLADIHTRLREAFGSDLSLNPQTPQAQLAGIVALALTEVGEAIEEDGMAASVDHAGGVLLDALGSLVDVRRNEATRSRVSATVTGVAGAGLPAGSRAKTVDGAEFRTTEDVILAAAGVQVEMEALEYGPVAAAAGSLTSIVTIVPGWETITNANAAVQGRAKQTDNDYRTSYMRRTAHSSIGPMSALAGALEEAKAGRVRIVENNTDAVLVVQQWTIRPHAILILAESGADGDLRRAIENHRGLGVATMAAVVGGDPDNPTLNAVANGTVEYDGTDYTGLDLTGTADQAAKAAAVNALTAGTVPIPITLHYEWPSDGYYVATYLWMPNASPEFGSGAVEDAFGLDPESAVQQAGPFVRPHVRPLTVVVDVTQQDGFPGDGLQRIRDAITGRVDAYGIGEQVWLNDLLCEVEAIPGTRVTTLTVQEAGRNISGVAVPLDALWSMPAANLTITIT